MCYSISTFQQLKQGMRNCGEIKQIIKLRQTIKCHSVDAGGISHLQLRHETYLTLYFPQLV